MFERNLRQHPHILGTYKACRSLPKREKCPTSYLLGTYLACLLFNSERGGVPLVCKSWRRMRLTVHFPKGWGSTCLYILWIYLTCYSHSIYLLHREQSKAKQKSGSNFDKFNGRQLFLHAESFQARFLIFFSFFQVKSRVINDDQIPHLKKYHTAPKILVELPKIQVSLLPLSKCKLSIDSHNTSAMP